MLTVLLFLMQATVEPSLPDLHVLDNDKAGARAYSGVTYCFANAPAKYSGSAKVLIADLNRKCSTQTQKLRAELVRIYANDRSRLPVGASPDEAAQQFVVKLVNRMDYILVKAGLARN